MFSCFEHPRQATGGLVQVRQVQNDASPHQVTIERWTEVLHRMSSLESNRDYTLRLLKRDLSQALTNDPMPKPGKGSNLMPLGARGSAAERLWI